ncbi:hypothetical protein [Goodfellowiella coeruleoviolacea]|uniref:hypothetical protein n=1 Tax=Goodfellowiella coeruleoviolacea TaxID=334858 RepID=UPI0020A3E305|nr:hypothetical protein [Goodfellowiella coeruleoviolacea]
MRYKISPMVLAVVVAGAMAACGSVRLHLVSASKTQVNLEWCSKFHSLAELMEPFLAGQSESLISSLSFVSTGRVFLAIDVP